MAYPTPEEIAAAVERHDAGWTAGPNPITALTREQRRRRLGLVVNEEAMHAVRARRSLEAVAPAAVPAALDWRDRNGRSAVTPVRDQLQCGACVSFCTVATVESKLWLQVGKPADLSEADLHFCSPTHGANCDGWWPSDAYEELRTRGVSDEAAFPYRSAFDPSGQPRCRIIADHAQRAFKVTGATELLTTARRKAWIAENGPVCAGLTVFSDLFAYRHGVYRHVTGEVEGGHCVEVIGWSDADGCWICKNSWGTDWGERGFFRIAYGQCDMDDYPFWGVNGVGVPHPRQTWHAWTDRGGSIASAPAVAAWSMGRLDVFATGADGHLLHAWANDDVWRAWQDLGGSIDGPPAAISWGADRIDCFGRSPEGHLLHRWWDGHSWSGWQDLGGSIASAPAASTWRRGRLDVFTSGADGHLLHKWYDGGRWSVTEDLGGDLDGAPAAVSWGPDRIDCFARSQKGHLMHRWWDGHTWGWQDLGGSIASAPAASSRGLRRLDVFATGANGHLLHKWYDGSRWSVTEDLGGTLLDAPAAVSSALNRIDCFARGQNGHLMHRWWM
jgi:Papain family cysteine protease/Repeat of unknown function (DUF346)